MMTTGGEGEKVLPKRLKTVTFSEYYWKDPYIEEWQNKRVKKEKANEFWWNEEGPHGFEIVKYLGDVIMLKELCMEVREIPELMNHQLFTFLKTCNYYVKKGLKLILNHYKHRNNIVDTFQFRNPYLNEIQKVWNYVKFTVLPGISIRNSKLIFIGLWNFDPHVFEFIPVLRLFNMAIEACTMCYNMHTSYEFIIDGEGFSLSHIPPYMKTYFIRFIRYLQHGFPLNVIAIHVVHASHDLITIIHDLSYLISKEITSKIYYHSYYVDHLHSLFQILGKKNLPSDIEGYGECVYVSQHKFQDHVESLWGWFKMEEAEWTRLIYHIKSDTDISLGSASGTTKEDDITHTSSDSKLHIRKKLENIYNKVKIKLTESSCGHSSSSTPLSSSDYSTKYMKYEKEGFQAEVDWLEAICIIKENYNKRKLEENNSSSEETKQSNK